MARKWLKFLGIWKLVLWNFKLMFAFSTLCLSLNTLKCSKGQVHVDRRPLLLAYPLQSTLLMTPGDSMWTPVEGSADWIDGASWWTRCDGTKHKPQNRKKMHVWLVPLLREQDSLVQTSESVQSYTGVDGLFCSGTLQKCCVINST